MIAMTIVAVGMVAMDADTMTAIAVLATIPTVTVAVVAIIVMTMVTEASTAMPRPAVMTGTVTAVTEATVTVIVGIAEETVEAVATMTEMMLARSLLLGVIQTPLPIVSLMSLLAVELTITVGTIEPAPAR